ncbi:DNA-(apurinic or apyrimidinic site) lyase [Haematococcus lacustris]|uniref:DNA-(Apurinic or apyrimidinic site) lyase n=1 Tax=Haematococcus lacustris TaxID=44745 RepID=A0A699YP98_HAELA|nr:DNA-(apurinic or apyrimidinic site) lyase [Haematococcus lacustris]
MHPSLGSHAAAYSAAELDWVRGITRDFPDAWRSKHPAATDCFTVWEERTSARAFNAGCRIDLILLSPELLPQVLACDIVTDVPPKVTRQQLTPHGHA